MTRKLTDEEIKLWQKAVKKGFRFQDLEGGEKKAPNVESRTLNPKRIDARIDLHGLTLEKAHKRFMEFIYAASMDNLKKLLVITGKGSGNTGKIRSELPLWCDADYLKPLITSCKPAEQKHGGDGAFYVTLKKTS
jgi:DNA-nicking Smr family endonuclease